jgi:hypothetical protein
MDFGYLMGWAPLIAAVLLVLVHGVIAFSLNIDANRRSSLVVVGPIGWFILGLGGGFIALGFYWVMHYSTFRASSDEKS